MPHIKVYGVREHLNRVRDELSSLIHTCVVEALQYPPDKRCHRFIPIDREDFFMPADRTERYTIIEISMFEGRPLETKKHLLRLLMDRIANELEMKPADIEITIFETPRANWGIRGVCGDELQLNYKVDVKR